MKLRTAIRKADGVYVQASYCGTPIRFRVSKAEALRVISRDTIDLDQDLDDEDHWSQDDGCNPFWSDDNDLVLSYT